MKDVNTGGPAFPMSGFDMRHGQPVQAVYQHGMTLRDYFAAKAMEGMFASGNLPKSVTNEEIADVAYDMADTMLKARAQ